MVGGKLAIVFGSSASRSTLPLEVASTARCFAIADACRAAATATATPADATNVPFDTARTRLAASGKIPVVTLFARRFPSTSSKISYLRSPGHTARIFFKASISAGSAFLGNTRSCISVSKKYYYYLRAEFAPEDLKRVLSVVVVSLFLCFFVVLCNTEVAYRWLPRL
jgi:hypothetical protein